MSDRIALQLYTIRDAAQNDYAAAVRKIASMGYRAVETAGFPGTTAEAAAKLFEELGLTVVAAHTAMPLGEKKAEILETLEALGKPTLVCTQIRPDDVKTVDTIRNLCDRLNEAYQVSRSNGIRFGIHNHWWEFDEVDGRLPHVIMRDLLHPEIFFELDTYWIQVAGHDSVPFIRDLGARAPLLHIKDGPGNREDPMTAVGEGVMDIPAILQAGGDNARWWIVEMDRCGTDVMEAVKKSYDYLVNL